MSKENLRVSVEAQLMVNDLIANAANIYSEFPVKAMKAKARVDELKSALLQYIAKAENKIPE